MSMGISSSSNILKNTYFEKNIKHTVKAQVQYKNIFSPESFKGKFLI